MSRRVALTIANAETATFECTFGRGCVGICCQNGRPSLTDAEQKRVQKHLKKFLPHLRPEARDVIATHGFLSRRTKLGYPMLRVVDGWCLFFNEGCVFHKVGLEEGDFTKYKPWQCVTFPLDQTDDGTWYVRQWGYENEPWGDLFCLNPKNTTQAAVESLVPEIDYAVNLPPR